MAGSAPEQKPFSMPAAPARAEITVKKSRFIAQLFPVMSWAGAEARLREVRQAHPAATHHCFACTAGVDVPVERCSDDGEPAGTAGRPILEVLRRAGLANALLVVTRYFGGVLLGAPGLVRAYSEAAAAAVARAGLLRCRPMHRLEVCCDYASFGKLQHGLTQLGCPPQNAAFAAAVSFSAWVEPDRLPAALACIQDTTGGKAEVAVHPPAWVGVLPDGSVADICPPAGGPS